MDITFKNVNIAMLERQRRALADLDQDNMLAGLQNMLDE